MALTTNIVLVGNPNNGKTSLFNALTGLNQKVGNYAGVTVDKKIGTCTIETIKYNIIDLPGTYSLYPKSSDEFVAYDALFDTNLNTKPDVIIILADASNLKRNLLFATQIIDLGYPVILALTMVDIANGKGIQININELAIQLGVPIIPINPRKGKGIITLKKQIALSAATIANYKYKPFWQSNLLAPEAQQQMQQLFPNLTNYAHLHLVLGHSSTNFLDLATHAQVEYITTTYPISKTKLQGQEVIQRYALINKAMRTSVREVDPLQKEIRTAWLDKFLLHKIGGNIILLLVLFLLFQSIFWLASYPMDWIDVLFAKGTNWLSSVLPQNLFTNFLINGLIAGLGGIIVFVPQIMILFGLITILEDTGYMARISFLTDRLMRSVGLNGKAAVPIISGMACAVPAIMGARTIENKKQRLITILVTPLTSCSARLPVYTILIALVVPNTILLGFISLKGLVMMGLYMLGFLMALLTAKLLDIFIKVKDKGMFLMELPIYKAPRWQNIGITMVSKAKVFLQDAGKIIIVISLVLWAMCNFGPSAERNVIENKYNLLQIQNPTQNFDADKNQELIATSYAGHFGKLIEPAIKPLGFDWKIGIALIASFAAREVFVGTMSTIYSAGSADVEPLMKKMEQATFEDGSKVYTPATAISLMLFYVFAMQCMSTLAIVKKETGSWRWSLIQFIFMGALAYLSSLLAYQMLK